MPVATRTPISIDYANYYSLESKNRQRSRLKEIKPFSEMPGMINFGVGIPHPSTFPVDGMTLSLPFVQKSVFVPGFAARDPEALLDLTPYTQPSKTEALTPDLGEELQYSGTFGQKHFVKWIKEHVTRVHQPKYEDWEVCCTAGNTDGVDGVMRALLDRGDHVLVEEFAYPGLLSPAASLGFKCVGVQMDEQGITAESLEHIMSTWDEAARGGPKPKLLVLVPTCSNPAGVTIPVERKREIYDVCRNHNLLICEDDPYCFLQIRPNGADSPIVPTFLSLDIDGRVIRVDSFSKIVAPGARLGWITGPAPVVEKIMNTRESATQCPSGFSVAAVAAILRAWGSHDGFEKKYIPHISDIYSKRCLLMIDLLQKHVDPRTIEIPKPSGGMFLFPRLKIESHPDFPAKSPSDIAKGVFDRMIEEKVLAVPGLYFRAPALSELSAEEEARKTFFRVSFSLPTPDVMEEGVKRIGRALNRDWRL